MASADPDTRDWTDETSGAAAMMYPYAGFLIDFDREHADLTHRNRPDNRRCAVIVESRPVFFLPKVVRNVVHFLGPAWNLHVLGSPGSLRFLRESLQGWEFSDSVVTESPRLSTAEYNRILLSPQFWTSLPAEKVLVFQTDSLLTGSNIEDFADYDLIGAPCGRFDEGYIANGGLSLRTREVMLDCLLRFAPAPNEPEDVYFTRAARRLGAKMPDFQTATRFSLESVYTTHPVGVHGTDKFFHPVEVAEQVTRAIRF
jgi:hypothetical protein